MNTKSIILAGAMSLGLASLASAQQYVYLTGSTAARSIVDATMKDGASVFDAAPTVLFSGGSSSAGASYVNYSNTIGGVSTIIKCHWSGSEGGIADLAGSGTQSFLTDDGTAATVSSTVDLAMADNAATYSKNPGAAVTGSKVGVIAFKWVAQKGSAATLTNIADQTIRQALKANAKLALFTGNPADTTRVFVSGRDNNSGTRVNALATCFYGIFTAPKQLQVSSTGAMITQTDGNIIGDYGYSGGGSLATQMGVDLSQATSVDIAPLGDGVSHFSVIAYLGTGDAASAVNAGARELTWNGVAFSLQNIQEGRYNFWGNEYVYRKNSVSTQATAVYNKLINATTGIPGHADNNVLIALSSMHATRTGPTTDPTHN